MKESVNYLDLANSPLMWVAAAIAVGIVVFQSEGRAHRLRAEAGSHRLIVYGTDEGQTHP